METVTLEQLRAMTLANWLPFSMELADGELRLIRCLRLLPGKRLAARAQIDGAPVFAKVFFQHGHGKLAERERNNMQRLADAGVRVPRLRGVFHEPGVSVLLTEWLDSGETLESCLSHSAPYILSDFFDQLEKVYQAGFYQADLHLDNFMVVDNRVRVLDSGDIRRLPKAGRSLRRRKLQNLALLCAQSGLALAATLEKEVVAYFGLSSTEADHLARRTRKARNRRIHKANRKWLRSCSAIRRSEGEGAVWFLERANEEEALSLLNDAREMTEIKRGSRIRVMGNRDWVLKHYRDTSLKARIKRWLGVDSARRSWVMGWTFDMVGVPTPRPAGWVSFRDGSALVLFPRVSGARLSEVMENSPEIAETAAEKVSIWLARMGDAGFWHGDMKAQNILLPESEPCFIDLDAAGWSSLRTIVSRRHRRDVKRFSRNRAQFGMK